MVQLRGSGNRNERFADWLTRVSGLLAAEFPATSERPQDLAATVIGMFDAGARDVEVVEFLERVQASAAVGAARLSRSELSALTVRLHRAAAGPAPRVAT